jgi:DNA primase
MISEHTIQKVRDLDIEEVVGRYVSLKKHQACCPFHNEKTPSFHVNPKRGIYKCFGCGESGDAIRFVQQIKRLTFTEAIEQLAAEHGIEVEYTVQEDPQARQERKNELDQAKEILTWAHQFYREQLKANSSAFAYLQERGIGPEIIEEWQLGFAPDDWRSITTTIVNKGWYTVAHKLGLVQTKDSSNYDAFRKRIIIPIHDKFGQLIGFGGRALGDEKPKYLNPNENFLYAKAQTLFGMDRAAQAITAKNRAILVEGYFDVISMHTGGVENVVATCGTAAGEMQLKLLRRYATNLTVMYDGDAAGQKAAEKVILMALQLGFDVFTVDLQGQDPDQFAQDHAL